MESKQMTLAVVGDYMIDKYIYVKPIKISSEAPVLVVKKVGEENRLGGAGNVAANLADLGVKVIAVGMRGLSGNSHGIDTLLTNKGIIDELLSHIDRETTVKTRIVAGDKQLLRVDKETTDKINDNQIEDLIGPLRSRYFDGIVISDYNKGVVTGSLIEGLKKFKKPIIVNGKPGNIMLYKGIDVLIFNKEEATEAQKIMSSYVMPDDNILKFLNIKYLVVTKGKDGLEVYSKDSLRVIDVKAPKVEVADITGAGDVAVALLAYKYIQHNGIYESDLEIVNVGAAKSIEKFGTSTVNWDDLDQYYREMDLKVDRGF